MGFDCNVSMRLFLGLPRELGNNLRPERADFQVRAWLVSSGIINFCRDKSNFCGGSWHLFKRHQLPFIQLLDSDDEIDEVYESLHWGVDTMAHATNNHAEMPYFRDRKKRLKVIPVYDKDYRRSYRGRDKRKKWNKTMGAPFLDEYPIGFRPILENQFVSDKSIGFFKTPKKTNECQVSL